jgi:hypothetical protein
VGHGSSGLREIEIGWNLWGMLPHLLPHDFRMLRSVAPLLLPRADNIIGSNKQDRAYSATYDTA